MSGNKNTIDINLIRLCAVSKITKGFIDANTKYLSYSHRNTIMNATRGHFDKIVNDDEIIEIDNPSKRISMIRSIASTEYADVRGCNVRNILEGQLRSIYETSTGKSRIPQSISMC